MPTTMNKNNNQTINFDKQIQPFPVRRWQSPQAGLQCIEAAVAAGNSKVKSHYQFATVATTSASFEDG